VIGYQPLDPLLVRRRRNERQVQDVGRVRVRLPPILGPVPTAWTCPQAFLARQPLDAMQT